MQSTRFFLGLLAVFLVQTRLLADGPNTAPSETTKLDGKWLFESASIQQQNRLAQVWSSVISISSGRLTISKFLFPSKELKGRILWDEKEASHLDVEVEELDFSDLGEPVKIEAARLKGIIKFEGEDAVTIAMNISSADHRPVKFESADSVLLLRLRRAPKEFQSYPKEVTIQVETADGKPVAGAIAARFQAKRTAGNQADASREYSQEKSTDAAGVVVFPFEELPRLINDEKSRQIAFPNLVPSQLVEGKLKVKLAPACEVRGSIVCKELADAEQPIGWINVYLEANGESVANCSSKNGNFDFLVPPGDFNLVAYGRQLNIRKVNLSVQPNQSEVILDPIALKALGFVLLKGKPAPEFVEVAGWSGKPVKLSEMKGQYVLVDFWGYWCGPCVHEMPILIELHEKFSDKGLAIVGVHVDAEDDVDNDQKFREKTAPFVQGIWHGKELPFPNALVSGKPAAEGESRQPSGTPGIYGIQMFPTTILIDRKGNIVDEFPVHDLQRATEKIEKLLEKVD